jgi:acyl transferase domain-containing protein
VECHGTATPIGDPIEIAGLTEAFRSGGAEAVQFCAIGSVKSNLGHLDAAAGVVGLIKTALALHHRVLPASLHFQRPNPELNLESSPFYVNTQTKPWPMGTTARRAGVSSFGVGGTNAHVVLEEAEILRPRKESRGPHLLALSAKSPAALKQQRQNLAEYFRRNPDACGGGLGFTIGACYFCASGTGDC